MSVPSSFRQRFETIKLAVKILFGLGYGFASLLLALALVLGAFDSRSKDSKYIAYVFIVGFFVWMIREWLVARHRLQKAVARANTLHGTVFDLKKGLGFRRGVEVTLFDPQRRKILFLKHDGRFQWVVDFEQVESWEVGWKDRTRLHRLTDKWVTERVAVRLKFYFRDVMMPSVTMAIANYELAKDWSQRLSILLRTVPNPVKGGPTG